MLPPRLAELVMKELPGQFSVGQSYDPQILAFIKSKGRSQAGGVFTLFEGTPTKTVRYVDHHVQYQLTTDGTQDEVMIFDDRARHRTTYGLVNGVLRYTEDKLGSGTSYLVQAPGSSVSWGTGMHKLRFGK